MDLYKLPGIENLLRLPGSSGLVSDISVISCGCLVSESQFASSSSKICPTCNAEDVRLLSAVAPLRELFKLVKNAQDAGPRPHRGSASQASGKLNPDSRKSSHSENLDLLGLFCKYAKDDQLQSSLPRVSKTSDTVVAKPETAIMSIDQNLDPNFTMVRPAVSQSLSRYEDELALGLNAEQERNFSQCFPFHRKISSFQTGQGKFSFGSRSLVKKLARFTGSAISTHVDRSTRTEITTFVLISDKKWELYQYTMSRPVLLALGKSTGEYGPRASDLQTPKSQGFVVRNDFSKSKSDTDIAARLAASTHLSCCLSGKFLVISGTSGVIRVLNTDPNAGDVGAPVYTYLTNFPIRCISVSPNNELVACGITTREKISGKQQPFIILHRIEKDLAGGVSVKPITIAVPYRDPLKLLTFNASSTHVLACTVYESRYFIIRLRGEAASDYKKPRLIFSGTRASHEQSNRRGSNGSDGSDRIDGLFDSDEDDQMLDNEGITDIKFGPPFSNTMVMTSSSLKNRHSIVLKLNGPTIDTRSSNRPLTKDDGYNDIRSQTSQASLEEDDGAAIADSDLLMKLPEIGSNIYRTEVSPRGDGIIFVDKSGRLLLVSTPNAHFNLVTHAQPKKCVVLLGEVSPSLRASEAASVCFSSDGGKVFAIDRKGLFQVFDFTKGIPGEDSEVIKCKIISV